MINKRICFSIILLFLLSGLSCNDDEEIFDMEVVKSFSSFLGTDFLLAYESRQLVESLTSNEIDAQTLMISFNSQFVQFLTQLGFDESDILTELGSLTSNRLFAGALTIFALIIRDEQLLAKANLSDSDKSVLSCMVNALPLMRFTKVIEVGIEEFIRKNGKKALVKLVGKSLAKTFTWVGLALVTYEMSTCIRGNS